MTKSPSRRTLVKRTRFLSSEWDSVKARAAEAGKRPATYLREAALSAQVAQARPHRASATDRLITELSRLGNNLNQLARAANASGRFGIEEQLKAVLAEVLTLIGKAR